MKKYRDGSLALMANGSEQSGLYFDSLWTGIFKHLTDQKIFFDPKNVLILGCGGGTQPKLLNGPFKGRSDRKITVIEIDENVVTMAKKHFGLSQNKNLTVIIGDAFKTLSKFSRKKEKFDLVIVDLFVGETVPKKITDRLFLQSLSKITTNDGLIIFNYSPKKKSQKGLKDFESALRRFFQIREELLPIKLNQIIICQPIQKPELEKNYRQTREYEKFINSFGWTVKWVNGVAVLIRRLPIFSSLSLIKVARPPKLFPVTEIDNLARENHALMVKFDPGSGPFSLDDLRNHGYRKDAWSLLSTSSVVLDLKASLTKIFCQISPQARRKLKKIQQEFSKFLVFEHISSTSKVFPEKMAEFITNWDKFSSRRKIYSSKDAHMDKLVESFGKSIELFFIHHQKTNETLWGLLILRSGKTAYYLHTFTSLVGREFSSSYWGVWQALPILKRLGLEKLDFEGTFDERFPKSRQDWVGLTQFKLDWGTPIYFPGSFVKYYNPLIKLLFSVFSNHWFVSHGKIGHTKLLAKCGHKVLKLPLEDPKKICWTFLENS